MKEEFQFSIQNLSHPRSSIQYPMLIYQRYSCPLLAFYTHRWLAIDRATLLDHVLSATHRTRLHRRSVLLGQVYILDHLERNMKSSDPAGKRSLLRTARRGKPDTLHNSQ